MPDETLEHPSNSIYFGFRMQLILPAEFQETLEAELRELLTGIPALSNERGATRAQFLKLSNYLDCLIWICSGITWVELAVDIQLPSLQLVRRLVSPEFKSR